MTTAVRETRVEALRPEAIAIEPLLLDRVFEDPGAVLALIEERAPYPTLSRYHGMVGGDAYAAYVLPWFRTNFDDEWLLHEPAWVEGATRAFGARVVQPFRCILNINPAGPVGAAHVDLPVFRGSHKWAPQVWLLMSMGSSGLFDPWMVPVASGLAWFYRGVGGAFEYWPDGPDAPSRRQEPPMWNVGQISDNEYMFHRVDAIGHPEDVLPDGALRADAMLHCAGGGRWEIRDGEDVIRGYDLDELRISLLWKAYVFQDEAQLASFRSHEGDLTLERVVDVFCADLERRGVAFERPTDPLTDHAWQKVIVETYPLRAPTS